MDNEFDIDAPADMNLLGGTADDAGDEGSDQPAVAADGAAATGDADVGAAAGKADSTEEDQTKAAGEGEPAQPKRDAAIPRARFDEVNAKLHAERQETERLRAELAARTAPTDKTAESSPDSSKKPVDIDALEGEYYDCLMTGDKNRAKEIRSAINAEIYARAEATSAEVATRQVSEREAKVTFAQAVSKTISDFPFLDSSSPDSKPEAIAEVIEWRDFYIAKGDTPAAALQKAAAKIAPLYSAAPAQVTPVPPVDKRKQAAAAAGAEVSAAQPPRVDAGVGNRAIPAGDAIIGNQDKWERASESERLQFLQ